MNNPISIAVVDDQEILRKGIIELLSDVPETEVIHEANNGSELIQFLASNIVLPDIVLMDVDMPVMNGFETTSIVKKKYPDVKVLILTSYESTPFIEKAVELGASGFLSKYAQLDDIYGAIFDTYHNGFHFNEFISKKLIKVFKKRGVFKHELGNVALSQREVECIRLICDEKTDQEIGEILSITTLSAETYRKRILKKLNLKKSVGLAVYASKHKLI